MSQFFFAWVDAGTAFNAGTHAVEAEKIFGFAIEQREGGLAELSILIQNPRVGLLNPGRKQWAWFAWNGGSGVEALFLGRLVGVPQQLTADTIQVALVARPSNFAALKAALAATLKVLPYYDPVWINPDFWNDPDVALEARPAVWHVNRTSHALTASDIIEGAGTTYTVSNHDETTLSISYGERPANRIECVAEVRWQNEAKGSIDISTQLTAAFVAAGSSKGRNFLTSYTGEGLERTWPKQGARIGAGWTVGVNTLTRTDLTTTKQNWFSIRVKEPVNAYFPLWTFKTTFSADYEVSRSYSERVSFAFGADVQPIFADPDSEDTIRVSLSSSAINELIDEDGSANVAPLRDARFRSYFKTDRGKQSLEYLILYCRARLLARARAVTIAFEAPFTALRNISCDDNVTIVDPRLPGGEATGKVIGYRLSLAGEGKLRAAVSIACTIGRGGSVSSSVGSPTYVADGYVEDGYQTREGGATELASADITYSDFDAVAINDDGLDLRTLTAANSILSLVVLNGETEQETALSSRTFEDVDDAIDTLNGVATEVALSLKPLTGGPFETEIPVTISDLVIPQTIDLGAS